MVNGKRCAYVAVIDEGYRLGIAVEGESGYHRCKEETDAGGTFADFPAAQACAKEWSTGPELSGFGGFWAGAPIKLPATRVS